MIAFKVSQGEVKIESVQLLRMTPEMVIFLVDFRAKYAEHSGNGSQIETPNGTCFYFSAGDETLNKEDSDEMTSIEISGLPEWEKFHCSVEMGRYYAKVIMASENKEEADLSHLYRVVGI